MALDAAAAGAEGPFAIRRRADDVLIGSSRYLNVRRPDRVVEIGWSWLTPSAWRTGADVEAKMLMMGHAFEALGCVRVEFKTDSRNERSRAALAALPAQFEGVMRRHMIVPEIGQRDSAYYSVIDEEWPGVRENLERRLARGGRLGAMYDYVIVGAGSAGCVLASRLTEDPDTSVLLLEAGPPDVNDNIHVPLGYLQLPGTEVDWNYWGAPEPQCNDRRIPLPRGRVLGGSSSINAMVYIRGNRRDYDEWDAAGWSWDDLFPYFLRSEDNERGESEWHAVGGPLAVSDQRSGIAITPAFVEAGVEAGLARNEDFNGAEQDGVGMYQVTQRGGMRASTSVSLSAPGDGAAEPHRGALHPSPPGPVRGQPGDRGRGLATRAAPGAHGRARGDPLRRLLQLATASDALRGRPGRAPDDAGSRGGPRPACGR